MSRWKRINYSLGLAILLTALAWLFSPGPGEFLAVPGILIEGWVNLLILMVSREEYPFQFDNWVSFSILLYTVSIYFGLSLYLAIRSERATAAAVK